MNSKKLHKVLHAHQKWLANLGGCQANLRGADLSEANLAGANLAGANLSRANLVRADLAGANLRETKLCGADLSEANLDGANLSGADLSEAVGIVWADCSFSDHGECGRRLLAIRINGQDRFFCGCFYGTLKDLDIYIAVRPKKLRASRTIARNFIVARMAETVRKKGKS